MSYTLIDYFNAFQQLKRKKDFSAGVQATWFAILGEFNLQRFPAKLYLSTRELKHLAGLKSVSSAQEARNILKNNKLIDFHSENGTTVYTLGTEHLPNSNRTATEQQVPNQPNTSRTPRALSTTLPVCPTVETKTLRQDLEENKKSAGAKSSNLEEFLTNWAAGNGCARSDWLDRQLAALLDKHGLATMTAALERANRKANNTQGGFSLEFFEKQLAKVSQSPKSAQKPKFALKGGESNGETVSKFGYKPVEFDETLW